MKPRIDERTFCFPISIEPQPDITYVPVLELGLTTFLLTWFYRRETMFSYGAMDENRNIPKMLATM